MKWSGMVWYGMNFTVCWYYGVVIVRLVGDYCTHYMQAELVSTYGGHAEDIHVYMYCTVCTLRLFLFLLHFQWCVLHTYIPTECRIGMYISCIH